MFSTDVIIPAMSMAATVAAAFAALLSWRTARASTKIARANALANHHREALVTLTDELTSIEDAITDLERCAFSAMTTVPAVLEHIDDRASGGRDPRPIRHVVHEAAEIALAEVGDPDQEMPSGGRTYRLCSPIRDGGAISFDEKEFWELLSRADGVYADYQSVFGEKGCSKDISKSCAYRFCIYQMHRRLSIEGVRKALVEMESEKSANSTLQEIVEKIGCQSEKFKEAQRRLRLVRSRTDSSAFPLSMDPGLKKRFEQVERSLEMLVEDIDTSFVRDYQSKRADDLVHCYFIQLEAYCVAVYAAANRLLNAAPGRFE
jgi:hypothetical protein